MDASLVAYKLQHFLTESPGDRDLWAELCARYPYFAQARLMHYADRSDESGSLPRAALFKQDPFLFASFCAQVKEERHLAVPEEEIPVPDPSLDAPDVLTLISELPNSNPITEAKEAARQQQTGGEMDRVPDAKPLADEPPALAAEVAQSEGEGSEADRSLLVMMSFNDWLQYFKSKKEKEEEEQREKLALRTSWQKEKLAAVVEEDVDEIPEPIFRQAMDSISEGADVISESLAGVLVKQGKTDRAIAMYRKLSLRFPEKSAYFADLIDKLTTNRD
jgi:hypothetical protein